jgi:hypothetical protein
MGSICTNEEVDHYDTRGHKNICLILVWHFEQRTLVMNVECYVITIRTPMLVNVFQLSKYITRRKTCIFDYSL